MQCDILIKTAFKSQFFSIEDEHHFELGFELRNLFKLIKDFCFNQLIQLVSSYFLWFICDHFFYFQYGQQYNHCKKSQYQYFGG